MDGSFFDGSTNRALSEGEVLARLSRREVLVEAGLAPEAGAELHSRRLGAFGVTDVGCHIPRHRRRDRAAQTRRRRIPGAACLQSHQVSDASFIRAAAVVDHQDLASIRPFDGLEEYVDAAVVPRRGDAANQVGTAPQRPHRPRRSEGCWKATARRWRSRRRGPNCRWAGWPSFEHAELALTIMLDDLGRFDCSVADGVDADSEPSSPLLALAGLVGLGRPSQQVA